MERNLKLKSFRSTESAKKVEWRKEKLNTWKAAFRADVRSFLAEKPNTPPDDRDEDEKEDDDEMEDDCTWIRWIWVGILCTSAVTDPRPGYPVEKQENFRGFFKFQCFLFKEQCRTKLSDWPIIAFARALYVPTCSWQLFVRKKKLASEPYSQGHPTLQANFLVSHKTVRSYL